MLQNTPGFASYSVSSIEDALVFYRDTLGLDVEQSPEGIGFTLQGGGKIFMYPKSDHQPATFTVLNFAVSDIEKTVQELKDKGIELEKYDNDPMKADEQGIYRGRAAGMGPDIAWFKDPAGNILSVLQSD